MRILLIANAYPTRSQPTCTVWLRNMVEAIEHQGFRVNLLVIPGVAGHRILRLLYYCIFFLRVYFARLDRYDYVYLHFPSHSSLPLLLRSWSRTKLVVHLHGSDLLGKGKRPWLRRLTMQLLIRTCERADLTVVPSRYFADRLQEKARPRAVHVYPSGGVDTTRFVPDGKQSPCAPLRVGSVGRLADDKGIAVLLGAAARLEPSHKIAIHGGGPARDTLERLARALRIDGRVKFEGPTPYEELPRVYATFDVFVFPTLAPESLGLVAIEAMACGVPVIGSRMGALPDYIEHGVNGFLFTPGDEAELAAVLDAFARLTPDARRQMGEAARHTALRYDRQATTAALLSAFESLNDLPMRRRRTAA